MTFSIRAARSNAHTSRKRKAVRDLSITRRAKRASALVCPECTEPLVSVTESRPSGDGREVFRRRACRSCDHRWLTVEIGIDRLAGMERDATTIVQDASLAAAMDVFLKALEARGYTIVCKEED